MEEAMTMMAAFSTYICGPYGAPDASSEIAGCAGFYCREALIVCAGCRCGGGDGVWQ
jgi:hypothetical protein